MTDRTTTNPGGLLDRAISAVHGESPDDAAVESAAARVWDRLSSEAMEMQAPTAVDTIRCCADFQALIPAFVAGELPAARALLVEDHARTCAHCRKGLGPSRRGEIALPQISLAREPARERPWQRLPVRALAAAIVVATGLAGLRLGYDYWKPAPVLAHAETVDGALYRVTGEANQSLSTGEAIRERESIRSAKDTGAVLRLADGSLVEMAPRTEVALSDHDGDATVHLARGNVIVRAAEQGSGHLEVVTADCRVTVKGTIFSVRHGAKGSRVAVIQGQVVVTQGGEETTVVEGDEITTDPRLVRVSIAEEIAWSRDVDDYIALLEELKDLQEDWKQIPQPDLRYESRLLAGVPQDTALYAAVPNVSTTLGEAYRLLEERMADSEVLRDWWSMPGTPGSDPDTGEIIRSIETFGEFLGAEIVLASPMGEAGEPEVPIVMAELADQDAFRVAVEAEIDRWLEEDGEESDEVPLRFVDDAELAAAAAGGTKDPEAGLAWIGDGFLVAGADAAAMQKAVAGLRQSSGEGFAATPFGQQIRSAYSDGVSWLLAADMQEVISRAVEQEMAGDEDELRALEELGLLDVEYLIMSQKTVGDTTESRAALSFGGPRRGMAAWLAEPAPMGALDFVAADAYLASAAVVSDPSARLGELVGFATASEPEFEEELADLDAEPDLALLDDVAAALGGEIAVAIEGPVLPKPSWKLVIEVYDADRLQTALEAAIERANTRLADENKAGLALDRGTLGSRTVYTLRSLESDTELLHYVIADGYLVAAPARTLLERAIQTAQIGNNLANAEPFTSRLPHDGRADMSAVFYQNLEPLLGPLAAQLRRSSESLTEEQQQALALLAEDLSASLAYAYAEPDRIILASTTDSGVLGLGSPFGLGSFMGLHGVMSGIALEDMGQFVLPGVEHDVDEGLCDVQERGP